MVTIRILVLQNNENGQFEGTVRWTEAEIKTFWKNLDEVPMTKGTRLAFKLLLVLGQRRGETVTTEWQEFDLDKQTWLIPGKKNKNGRPHKVPPSFFCLRSIRRS